MKVRWLMVLAGTMGLLLGPAQARAETRLMFLSGPVGGDWYSLGGTIGEIVKRNVPDVQVTVSTGGGISNGPQVERGKADLGLSQAMLYKAQMNSLEPYEKLPPARNLAALGYVGFVYQAYFLVKADSPLTSIEQMIAEKAPLRIAVSTKSSTPELAARRLLAEYGVTYKDIESWGGKVFFVGFAEAESLVSDGHCDAYLGPVLGAVVQMITTNDMRLLPWSEAAIDAVCAKYSYDKKTLPRGRYAFVTADTPALAEANIILVRKDMPDELAYGITKAMAENADAVRASGSTYTAFEPRALPTGTGGPLHPGAERYYREQGWLSE